MARSREKPGPGQRRKSPTSAMSPIAGIAPLPDSVKKPAALIPQSCRWDGRLAHRSLRRQDRVRCCTLNYADHAAETGAPIQGADHFQAATSAVVGPNEGRDLRGRRKPIGRRARRYHRQERQIRAREYAMDYVAGYCVINDAGARISDRARRPGTRARAATPSSDRPMAGDQGRGAGSAESAMWLEVDGCATRTAAPRR